MTVFVRRRISRQCRRRGECDDAVETARYLLDPDLLTIGFARRFATYKRADLLMSDVDRLCALLCDEERPVQIIFAGKAHPKDEPGKELIQRIANTRLEPRFQNRLVSSKTTILMSADISFRELTSGSTIHGVPWRHLVRVVKR